MSSFSDMDKATPKRIERFFTRVNCSVRTSVLYGDNVINCDTKTLSLQGMFLKTDHLIPLNTAINVTVYHSSQSTIDLTAKVVSTEPDGICIKINRLSINSFAQLRDLIFEQSNNNVKVIQETLGMLKCINWN